MDKHSQYEAIFCVLGANLAHIIGIAQLFRSEKKAPNEGA